MRGDGEGVMGDGSDWMRGDERGCEGRVMGGWEG